MRKNRILRKRFFTSFGEHPVAVSVDSGQIPDRTGLYPVAGFSYGGSDDGAVSDSWPEAMEKRKREEIQKLRKTPAGGFRSPFPE